MLQQDYQGTAEPTQVLGLQLRCFYLRIIQRTILYAVPVWWKDTNNSLLVRKLISVDRTPLLKICQAYKTTANTLLPILCDTLPIYLQANLETKLYKLWEENQPIEINSKLIRPEEVERPVDRWDTHPSATGNFFFDNPQTITYDGISTFTDGSKCNRTIGAGYCVLNNKHNIHYEKHRLSENSTIFDAELLALTKAMENVCLNKPHGQVNVYSDSLSVLTALRDIKHSNPRVRKLQKIIQEVQSITIVFFTS